MSPSEIQTVGFTTTNRPFMFIQTNPAAYMMSVLLPIPTTTGQFASFDVYYYKSGGTKEDYYQLILSGGEKSAIRMKVDRNNVVHSLPGAAIEGRGIGSLGYYSATVGNMVIRQVPEISSEIAERSPEADTWWGYKTAAGIAGSDGKFDTLSLKAAIDRIYVWRWGPVPSWAPENIKPNSFKDDIVGYLKLDPAKVNLLRQLISQSPLNKEIPTMLRNIYPSSPEVVAEAQRLSSSGPIGALQSMLARRPRLGFIPSQISAYEE
jgi:hypothetical protein